MTFEQALATIESHEHAANLGIASGLGLYLRIMAKQDAVRALETHLDLEANHQAVFHRILELARRPFDRGFRHPWDSALATYAFVMVPCPPLARLAANVLLQTPNCSWARQMARRILLDDVTHNDANVPVRESPTNTYDSATIALIPPEQIGGAVPHSKAA